MCRSFSQNGMWSVTSYKHLSSTPLTHSSLLTRLVGTSSALGNQCCGQSSATVAQGHVGGGWFGGVESATASAGKTLHHAQIATYHHIFEVTFGRDQSHGTHSNATVFFFKPNRHGSCGKNYIL